MHYFVFTGRDMGNNSDRWNPDNGGSNNSHNNNNNSFSNFQNSPRMNQFNRNNMNENRNIAPAFAIKPYRSVLDGGVLQGYASAREIKSRYPAGNDVEIIVLDPIAT